MYDPNPPRRCGGSKQTNSFYAESGELSSDGTLHPWTWLLGDGLKRNIFMKIPPRQIQLLNPVLTVLFKTFMPASGPSVPIPKGKRWLFDHLMNAMSALGAGDHVGTQYYTPFNFAAETRSLGPSRRISPQMATVLGTAISTYGPLPMMFTHKEIPAFRTPEEMAAAQRVVGRCLGATQIFNWDYWYMRPTWTHDNWGMYARRNQWTGDRHFMIPILDLLDDIRNDWKKYKDNENWKAAKKFFRGIRFTEQTFGLSWLTKVTYTTPADGEEPADETLQILERVPGINILDLAQLDEPNKMPEDANGQITN